MWDIHKPQPVKLIIGILAADRTALAAAVTSVEDRFGSLDLQSTVWPFTKTQYYKDQTGTSILRQFVTIEKLIDPGTLASIKHQANRMEQQLAKILSTDLPRPVNLDPGYLEPSKLVLASTKNFSHRIYIGENMYAEVTLSYHKGQWIAYPFTFPDYLDETYHDFLTRARNRLSQQLKDLRK